MSSYLLMVLLSSSISSSLTMMAEMAAFLISSMLAMSSSFSLARAMRSLWEGELAVFVSLLLSSIISLLHSFSSFSLLVSFSKSPWPYEYCDWSMASLNLSSYSLARMRSWFRSFSSWVSSMYLDNSRPQLQVELFGFVEQLGEVCLGGHQSQIGDLQQAKIIHIYSSLIHKADKAKIEEMIKTITQIQNYFYYQNQRMKPATRKQFTQSEDEGANYKELYLACKKNVAIFMSQVESEISSILKKHETEKSELKEEIERLRSELKEQSHNSSMHFSKISIMSNTKRGNSETKINTQGSLPREAVEQCLAKFSKVSLREQDQNKILRQPIKIEKKAIFRQSSQEQKQNLEAPANFVSAADLGDLKLLSSGPKRDTRIRERKVEDSEKIGNIKDVLKDLRGKLSSRDKNGSSLRQKNEPIKTVITPDLFAVRSRC